MKFKADKDHPNRGYLYERIYHDRMECYLAQQWEADCSRDNGRDLIELIFNGSGIQITKRDRYVAATIVQWFGTNCGFSMIASALRELGMYVNTCPTPRYGDHDDDPLIEAIIRAERSSDAAQATFDLSEPT